MPPVRFFCNHCNLMMKIGVQMAGRVVMCPQCGSRLQVPRQSDPQAEALYQFMKKKRADEKATRIVDSIGSAKEGKKEPGKTPQPVGETPKVSKAAKRPVSGPAQSPSPPEEPHRPAATEQVEVKKPPAETSVETPAELDEVDRWIDEFWATVPETDDDGQSRENVPHTLKHAPNDLPPNEIEQVSVVSRYRQTVALFRIWLLIVFLVGLIAGIYIHSTYDDFRRRRHGAAADSPAGDSGFAGEKQIVGNLYYPGFDGRPLPDADAVVIVLPQDSVPRVSMTIEGLRPDDGRIDPHNDSVQQIIEIGGLFQRTGADGSFSLAFETGGRHLVLMISSHAKRAEDTSIDIPTLQELRRFFRTPQELIGDYCYSLNEYDFQQGKYVLRHTFTP